MITPYVKADTIDQGSVGIARALPAVDLALALSRITGHQHSVRGTLSFGLQTF